MNVSLKFIFSGNFLIRNWTIGYRYCLVYIPGCPHLKVEHFYKVDVCFHWLSALIRCPCEGSPYLRRV